MTHAVRTTHFPRYVGSDRRPTAKTPVRPGFWSRLFSAMHASREREAARIAEAHLARTGFRFTDSIERELNERLINGGWNARR